MGPVEAIRSGFQRAVDFRGRSTRPEYWWWTLMTVIIEAIIGPEPTLLGTLASLALLVPTVAVTVRRLHDIDRSAWNLLWLLVIVIGWIVLIVYTLKPGTPTSNRYGPPWSPAAAGGAAPGDWDVPPPPPPLR